MYDFESANGTLPDCRSSEFETHTNGNNTHDTPQNGV